MRSGHHCRYCSVSAVNIKIHLHFCCFMSEVVSVNVNFFIRFSSAFINYYTVFLGIEWILDIIIRNCYKLIFIFTSVDVRHFLSNVSHLICKFLSRTVIENEWCSAASRSWRNHWPWTEHFFRFEVECSRSLISAKGFMAASCTMKSFQHKCNKDFSSAHAAHRRSILKRWC